MQVKNISRVTKNLYYISLFNTKTFKKFDKMVSSLITCSLRQENFEKHNLLNFIFLLKILTKKSPQLEVAAKSNAFLKIRKGSLLQARVNLRQFLDLNRFLNICFKFNVFNFYKMLTNLKQFNSSQVIQFKFLLDPTTFKNGKKLFAFPVELKLGIFYSTKCFKKQVFFLTAI